jgi:hypothetical protein
MHPKDEAGFLSLITAEPGTVFVDGPSWSSPRPPIVTEVEKARNYLIIWNPSETPELKGKHHRKDNVEWWYCENEFLTIQFLRSGFQHGNSFLIGGRIAIQTTKHDRSYFHELSAAAIEKRFRRLRSFIKKTYTNNVIIWQQIGRPRCKTNPSKPTANDWVGPYAMEWLREVPEERWVQQVPNPGAARGYSLDLVQP